MKGKGLTKTIFKNMDLKKVIKFEGFIRIPEGLGFKKNGDLIEGKGILVAYEGDLNDILMLYGLEPLWITLTDGEIYRFILSNGIAAIKLTNIVTWEKLSAKGVNYVNFFNNGTDVIMLRKEFDDLAGDELFESTKLLPEAYYPLKTLFHGGVMNSREGIYNNVRSYDLVSAHISNIVHKEYPLGKFKVTSQTIKNLQDKRHKAKEHLSFCGCVTFKNLRLKNGYIGIIYGYHDSVVGDEENVEIDKQGYIVNADSIRIAITETYLDCIDICYTYDSIENEAILVCEEMGKLPDNIREYVYVKFELKKGYEKGTKEYEKAKLILNYCYGFLCRTTNDYNHYSKGHKLKFPYQWGVYTCIYTTEKLVKAMQKVVESGGIPVTLATDSIKYIGGELIEGSPELGNWKYEGTYKLACVVNAYKAVYKKDDGDLDIKLAGCLKEAAQHYFETHYITDIFSPYTKIPQGKVRYEFNPSTSMIEPKYSDYTFEEWVEN